MTDHPPTAEERIAIDKIVTHLYNIPSYPKVFRLTFWATLESYARLAKLSLQQPEKETPND